MRNTHQKNESRSFASSSRKSSAFSLPAAPKQHSFDEMRKFIIGNTPEDELDQLWSTNYKEHLLPLLPELSPNKSASLVWTRQDDYLILHFYFDQSERREEMAEMLTHKSLEYLIERYRFMNLPVSYTLQQTLGLLASLQSAT